MTKFRNLLVICQCGTQIAQYKKGGSGRLRKMKFSRILSDPLNLLLGNKKWKNSETLFCPTCQKRLGTVQMIQGELSLKINQGAIRV